MSSSHTTSTLLHVHDEAKCYSVTRFLHEHGRADAHAKIMTQLAISMR